MKRLNLIKAVSTIIYIKILNRKVISKKQERKRVEKTRFYLHYFTLHFLLDNYLENKKTMSNFLEMNVYFLEYVKIIIRIIWGKY